MKSKTSLLEGHLSLKLGIGVATGTLELIGGW